MKLTSICRTKEIRGHEIPGIIKNGSYFVTDLQVFADGLVNCWEMVDLPMFERKLRSRWVVTSIPDGAELDIHGIGRMTVTKADWTHSPESLLTYVRDVVKVLNPRLENLYDCHGRDTEVINGVRYSAVSTGSGRPWKTNQPITPLVRGEYGKSIRHFQFREGLFHLVNIQLFNDNSVLIFGAGETQVLDFETLAKQLESSNYFRFPVPGEVVVIEGLVRFVAGDLDYFVELNQRAAEIHDLRESVHGRPGAIQQCMAAYDRYLAEPTNENKEALRVRYESVPEHMRIYCGDMDVKDIPIRMILYGKKEIEKWSHYQVAKQMGEALPSIRIPEPPDEPPSR